ncbi:MAG: hypothetical protein LBL65_03200 [Campylobacteraceae bacterium]|nr:hypothetical protein [Campylobacteraceae bacterium]
MAFANEEISKEQYEAYNIKAIDAKWRFSIPIMDWTIDKEKDIWLRLCRKHINGIEEGTIATWNFYWKGAQFTVFTKQLPAPKQKAEMENYAYIQILDLYMDDRYRQGNVNKLFPVEFPKEFAAQKRQILKNFKEALEVSNAGLGIVSTTDRYEIDLIYEEKLI